MKYSFYMVLVSFLFLSISQISFASYPSCDGSILNTTQINSSVLTKTCYWQGGNLYLVVKHGQGSGFTYSVKTLNNTNATLFVSGGGVYNRTSACITVLAVKYYPKSNYIMQMQTEGTAVNDTCYKAYMNLTSSLAPKTTTTSKPTTIYTTTRNSTISTSVTTILNITVSPSTPSLVLSSNHTYQNKTVNLTARAVSSRDAVEIMLNGVIVSQGLGITRYSVLNTAPGNYSVQAYDVSLHLYSLPLNLYILPTTTTSTTAKTSQSTLVTSASAVTTVQQVTTVQGTGNTQPGFFQNLWNWIVNFFSHL